MPAQICTPQFDVSGNNPSLASRYSCVDAYEAQRSARVTLSTGTAAALDMCMVEDACADLVSLPPPTRLQVRRVASKGRMCAGGRGLGVYADSNGLCCLQLDGQAELVFAAAPLTQPDDGERHTLSRAILVECTEEVDVIAHL